MHAMAREGEGRGRWSDVRQHERTHGGGDGGDGCGSGGGGGGGIVAVEEAVAAETVALAAMDCGGGDRASGVSHLRGWRADLLV